MTQIKLSSLKSNIAAEREGAWQDCPLLPGVSFLVLSTNSAAYQAARSKALRDIAKRYPTGNVPEEEMAQTDGEMLSKHILRGWKGLDVEYTADAAIEILCSLEYRVMRDGVHYCASQVGLPNIDFIETASKN